MIFKIIIVLSFSVLYAFQTTAKTYKDSLNTEISGLLNYLTTSQIKKSDGNNYYKGEWPSYTENKTNIILLGAKGKSAYDSNCFTTASIHNILAELVLKKYIKYDSLKFTLDLALKNIYTYKTSDSSYNFWHKIPYPEKFSTGLFSKKYKDYQQFRPNRTDYKYRFIYKYANVFDDADDTVISYWAQALNDSVNNKKVNYSKLSEAYNILNKYTDSENRPNISKYNKHRGFNYHTNAYLTWLGQERRANYFKWFFPYTKIQNIVFCANEVDCVVNANILFYLTKLQNADTSRINTTVSFVKKNLNKSYCQQCGIYYPTEFTLHYAVSKTISSNNNYFKSDIDFIRESIISNQNPDGSFSSLISYNYIQATLYAVNTLLNVSDASDLRSRDAITKGINFIRKYFYKEGNLIYLRGGVFFSGGTIVRYNYVWYSDAYTTALALEALTKYQKIVESN